MKIGVVKMDKRTVLFIALAATLFAGCIGGDRGPEEGEVRERMAEAVGDLDSYRFEIVMDQTVEFFNFDRRGSLEGERVSLRWTGEMNLTDLSSKEVSVSRRTDLAGERVAEDEIEVYILNGTLYQKMGDEWIGLMQPDPARGIEKIDQMAHLLEMIDRSDVAIEGAERRDGMDQYRLKVTPDDDTAYGIMLGQISSIDPRLPLMIDMVGLFAEGAELEWTVWISRETFLPAESRITTVYTAGPGVLRVPPDSPDDLQIRFETLEVRRFGGYNEPVVVVLPEEARGAPVLRPEIPAEEEETFPQG
jgi:hypothetical protein